METSIRLACSALVTVAEQALHVQFPIPKELRPDPPAQQALETAMRLLGCRERRPLAAPTTPFCHVQLEPARPLPKPQVLAPAPLSPGATFPSPTGKAPPEHLQQHAAKAAWAIQAALQPAAATAHLESHLLDALEQHLWCLPGTQPGATALDSARTLAATACALHAAAPARPDDQTPLALVLGDLSGIQRYLFAASHHGAGGVAKRLRARSFCLSMLLEAAALHLQVLLGSPMASIIMNAGGRFLLLTPGHPAALARIEQGAADLSNWMLQRYRGEVAVNLAWHVFPAARLAEFGTVLTECEAAMARAKARPLGQALQAGQRWQEELFVQEAPPAGWSTCQACHRETAPGDPDGERICATCRAQEALGRRLPRARSAAIYRGPAPAGSVHLLGDLHLAVFPDRPPDHPRPLACFTLRGESPRELPGRATRRYLANHIPLAPADLDAFCGDCHICQQAGRPKPAAGDPLYFDCLANQADGRPLLGYFKADVDLLGSLFCFGFQSETGAQRVTPAQITALSRFLDLFFAGHVTQLLAERFPLCYSVFAGGDDLFLVGPWDQIVKAAQVIQADFHRYTAGNPSVTLSAGTVAVSPRLPLSRAAEWAEAALKAAKDEPAPGRTEGRNQFTLFGETVPWPQVPSLLGHAGRLGEWLCNRQVGSGFVYRLLQYADLLRQFRQDTGGMQVLALLTYDLERNVTTTSVHKGEVAEVARWAQTVRDSAWQAATGQAAGADPALALHLRAVASYALNMYRRGERDAAE